MKVVFDTQAYGKIECDSETRVAYFHADDLEAIIDAMGDFYSPFNGTKFQVSWPNNFQTVKMARLEVWLPREIGTVTL